MCQKAEMMSEKMVKRPATPFLDLAGRMSEEVFFPAGARVLQNAGVKLAGDDDLVTALTFGSQVAQRIDTIKQASGSEVEQHVRRRLGVSTKQASGDRMSQIKTVISQSPDLSALLGAAIS
jgi:hypothetical protein